MSLPIVFQLRAVPARFSLDSMNAPESFEKIFTLAEGPPPPTFPEVGPNGRFVAPDGVNPSILPDQQRLPYVDAWNLTLQRELTSEISAEIGYVGNKGTHVFNGDGPDINFNQPILEGFPNVPLEAASMALPVVATRSVGCVDAVQDGITGLLVRSVDGAARGMPRPRRRHGAG